ncbi:molybdopterin-dependent oxidoreductase [Tundrisphaera lichenicola]|uniref:molybdopterin-dependent oxidoreductase n=1 Tax=Tundrisphaera lichenicola TaxID=2029860 RepID=UPI003EBD8579
MTMTWLAALILVQTPAPIGSEKLPCDLATLKAMDQAEVRVSENGKTVIYRGVPLALLLEKRVKEARTMPGMKSLSDAVLLVRGADGYQAAYSAAAVAMDAPGERYLLAIERDGEPLDKGFGPIRMIVPGDPKHARWVREVEGVRLVRLDKLVEP